MNVFKTYLNELPHYKTKYFENIEHHLSTRNIDPGEYFLRQGEVSKNIAFIEEGILRLYYLIDGKEVTTCFYQERTIVCSYQSLITNSPSDIFIQALEPCKLIVFAYKSLQELYTKDLFWQQVGRIAAEKEYIEKDWYSRFINDLSAAQRYQHILTNNNQLLQRVPLQYIASYLQITPETLSRIRKKNIHT